VEVSLIPERLIAETARDEGIDLEALRTADDADAGATRLLTAAINRWPAAVPQWKRLNFAMQQQVQTQWCWSATSVSVALFYGPSSGWTQCGMAGLEWGVDCCADGSIPACNKQNGLDAPLARAQVLDHWGAGPAPYADVQREVDAGRPLAWRIGWSGGGGHFAAIEGYQASGAQWVAVDDPWYGSSDVAVATLTGGGYQGSGNWTHTYFTRRPVPAAPAQVGIPPAIWDRIRVEAANLEPR
jgi:hypothetical protein